MGEKTVLLENINQRLSYIKEAGDREGRHYLGRLAGIGADWKSPTRNGRRYPQQLWENVFASEDYKEMMDTKTCFGENDHPSDQSGRIETSIKEISIALTKAEMRKDEGIVYCEFDILDTPQGRILKELCDYGSKIGISTRGLGDEIVKDGEKIIDPDTYVFYGWDAVIMPAVKRARPQVVESANRSLTESFKREIEQATTASELQSIKKIAEAANIEGIESIKDSIDIRLKSYTGEDISGKLSEDIGNLALENQKLKEEIESLKESKAAKDISAKLMLGRLRENSVQRISTERELNSSRKVNEEYEDYIFDGTKQIDELSYSVEGLTKLDLVSRNKVKGLTTKLDRSYESIKAMRASLSESKRIIAALENTNKIISEKYQKVQKSNTETNRDLRRQLDEVQEELQQAKAKKTLVEQRTTDTIRKTEKLAKNLSETVQEYLSVKCAQSGIDKNTALFSLPKNFTVEDVNRVVSELADRKRRIDKVPVDFQVHSVKLGESRLSDEDTQTLNIALGVLGKPPIKS